jgi:hypothetical protein
VGPGRRPEFRLEWKEYCEVWPAIKDRDTLRSSAFWRFKEATWPHLAPVARFWLEIPTSAISCERAIAKMRVFDTAERQSQKDDTFKREMFFRCNMWVLEKVHDNVLSKYSAVIDARFKAAGPRGRQRRRGRPRRRLPPSRSTESLPPSK